MAFLHIHFCRKEHMADSQTLGQRVDATLAYLRSEISLGVPWARAEFYRIVAAVKEALEPDKKIE